MIAPPNIAALAGSFTGADQCYLMQLRQRFSIHPGNQSRSVREFLMRAERLGLLKNPSFDNYFMQPLGQQVAAYLKEQSHDGQG